ncbi:hypothetical protein Hanom_Chr05g00471911 [Helianthus anomalus]
MTGNKAYWKLPPSLPFVYSTYLSLFIVEFDAGLFVYDQWHIHLLLLSTMMHDYFIWQFSLVPTIVLNSKQSLRL